jgi:hypothetical protein
MITDEHVKIWLEEISMHTHRTSKEPVGILVTELNEGKESYENRVNRKKEELHKKFHYLPNCTTIEATKPHKYELWNETYFYLVCRHED